MVRAPILTVVVDARNAIHFFDQMSINLPREMGTGMKEIAKKYAEIYLKNVFSSKSGIRSSTGRSINVLRRQKTDPVRLGKYSYGVNVPLNLIALDRLRQPFRIKIKKGSPLAKWYRRTFGFTPLPGQRITIKRHPWFDDANAEARVQINPIIDKHLRRAINKSKKIG